eukprot:5420236-Alexandrium_andersonii.AAC.1
MAHCAAGATAAAVAAALTAWTIKALRPSAASRRRMLAKSASIGDAAIPLPALAPPQTALCFARAKTA